MSIPERPTWKMFIALLGAFFVLAIIGGAVLTGMRNEIDNLGSAVDDGGKVLEQLQDNAVLGRQRVFANRAQGCMSLIVDNDRSFELTAACNAPEITAYYPQVICADFFPNVAECGTKTNDPAL